MADGVNEGIEFIGDLDISFGEIAEQIAGDLGDFKDEIGDIFGDVAEYGKDIGEKLIENVGDLIENAHEWLT